MDEKIILEIYINNQYSGFDNSHVFKIVETDKLKTYNEIAYEHNI